MSHFYRHSMTFILLGLLAIGAIFLLISFPTSSQASQTTDPSQPEYVPGRLLVKFRLATLPNLDATGTYSDQSAYQNQPVALDRLLADGSVLEARPLFPSSDLNTQNLTVPLADIYLLALPPGSDPLEAAQQLASDPDVEWAEPDYISYAAHAPFPASSKPGHQNSSHLFLPPSDPLFASQWGLAKISALSAWEIVTGTQNIFIAVIDSGIDLTHPDLQSQLWINPGEIPGNGKDDDSNGLVDDVNGWNFVDENTNVSDSFGHGTEVAGILAAATNNGLGISGVCWSCRIMPVKVMQNSGIANYSDIAKGVLYAAQKGAKVINLSLGGYANSSALYAAIQTAVNTYKVLIVAGGGNDNIDAPFYPAAYSEVLAVTGTGQSDAKVGAANFGNWIDLSAPGENITTTLSAGNYGPVSGASYAAPFVAGAAGVLRSLYPDWDTAKVYRQLLHTSDDTSVSNADYPGQLGAGRINLDHATSITPHPDLSITAISVNGDPFGKPIPGSSNSLQLTLSNSWEQANNVTGTLTTNDPMVKISQGATSFFNIASGETVHNSPLLAFTVEITAGNSHPISFNLQIKADGGYSPALTFTLTTSPKVEEVGEYITEDTTWNNSKIYIISDPTWGIAPGARLTIAPGTTVKLDPGVNFNVYGTLVANGSKEYPVRFIANGSSNWGRIFFSDSAVDATVDGSGNNLGGSLLSWVTIEDAAQGIVCESSTPQFSHLVVAQVGINCAIGNTMMDLSDSQVDGALTLDGTAAEMGSWHPYTGLVTERAGLAAAASDGKIYAIGGMEWGGYITNTVEEYDPAIDIWKLRSSLPTPRTALAAVALDGKIYAVGGISTTSLLNAIPKSSARIEEYDPLSNTWTLRANMPTPRQSLAAASLDNIIFAAGGRNSDGELPTLEAYIPLSDTWKTLAPMPTPRYAAAAIDLNHIIYVIGGRNTSGPLPTLEAYDPAMNMWTSLKSMPTPRSYLAASVLNGKIYAIGGENNSYLSTVEEYDPASNTWISRASLPTARYALAAANLNGRIYALGGVNTGYLSTVEEYTPPIFSWNAQLHRTKVTGSVSLPPNSHVTGSLFSGDLTVGEDSFVEQSSLVGNLNLSSGVLLSTTITGSVSINRGVVQSSKIINGGMSIGSGTTVSNNSIVNSPGWGISASGNVTLTHNRVVGCQQGINLVEGTVHGNLIANSSGVGLQLSSGEVTNNSFTGNLGNVIGIMGGKPVFHFNNLEGNRGKYLLDNTTANAINATSNWWGTNYTDVIKKFLHDKGDDWSLGSVAFSPPLTGPVLDAPGYVRGLNAQPNPLDIGSAQLDIRFSRGMDDAQNPTLSTVWFQKSSQSSLARTLTPQNPMLPIENFSWTSPITLSAFAHVNTLTALGDYTITIKNAVDPDGILIAPNSAFSFTVEYTTTITDITPPPPPDVKTCAGPQPAMLQASWSAVDPESAITHYRYAIGAAPGSSEIIGWTTVLSQTTSFSRSDLGLTAGKTYYVSVQARNKAGLWSRVSSGNEVIAGSSGCTGITIKADHTSGMTPLRVQFTSPTTSTLTTYLWSFGDGSLNIITATPIHTYTIPAPNGVTSTYTVTLDVRGPSGRTIVVRENYIKVTQDKQIPTGTIVIGNGDEITNSLSVSLTLFASDPNGIKEMSFSNDEINWTPWFSYTTAHNWRLLDGDGLKTVYVKYWDTWNNTAVASDTIYLDTHGPSGSITINDGYEMTYSPVVTLTLNASDPCGLNGMRFSNDGIEWSNWEDFSTSKIWTLPKGFTKKTVYVQFRDMVNNIAVYNDTISLRIGHVRLNLPYIRR